MPPGVAPTRTMRTAGQRFATARLAAVAGAFFATGLLAFPDADLPAFFGAAVFLPAVFLAEATAFLGEAAR